MAANRWMLDAAISPESACRCGHNAHVHAHGKSCTAFVDESKMKYCKCEEFREASGSQIQTQGDDMAKKEKSQRKKSEGRQPRLAGLVDSPLVIFMTTGGKEYKGTVLTSGMIKVDEKEFTSPSSAGSYILGNDKKGKPRQVDGWKSWTFNKDGERVALDTLRGSKSPLKVEEAKPKREKKAKSANSSPKPRKPRAARKSKANGAEAVSTSASQQEASA